MNRLSVDLCDQVSLPQPRIVGRAALLHMLRASRERETVREREEEEEREKREGEEEEEEGPLG